MSKESTARSAMKLALEALDGGHIDRAYGYIQSALEQPALVAKPHEQEPVAWICEGSSSDEKHAIDYWPEDVDDLPIGTQLYTSPPAQRTWVGLTDEERFAIADEYQSSAAAALMVEAKLKAKNFA